MISSSIDESRKNTLEVFSLEDHIGGVVPTASQLERSVSSRAASIVGLTSNTLGGAAFARGDHNEHFHEAVIDMVASTLDNEDILVSDRGFKAD